MAVSDPHPGAGTQVVRGVGALAAETLAEAAALVAALARQAGQAGPAVRAERIGARASALSVSNELAFARASRRLDAADHAPADDAALARARASAADVPLQVCQAASDLVVLAAELASGPMAERRLDLWGVVQLAAGACSCAALLVCANAALDADDARCVQARQAESAAGAAARRFLDQATTAKAAE
jgi:hypothetical protein